MGEEYTKAGPCEKNKKRAGDIYNTVAEKGVNMFPRSSSSRYLHPSSLQLRRTEPLTNHNFFALSASPFLFSIEPKESSHRQKGPQLTALPEAASFASSFAMRKPCYFPETAAKLSA